MSAAAKTTAAKTLPPPARQVLDFWFGDGLSLGWPSTNRSALWWGGGVTLDTQIQTQFGDLVEQALNSELRDWETQPDSLLALVIVLDQFTRNTHRGQARAFAGDARSQTLVGQAIAKQVDLQLPVAGRVFFYMPLMHSENLSLQNVCVHQFTQLHQQAPDALQEQVVGNIAFSRQHRDIIAQFGRFPHRNQALGRVNTPAEDEFLKTGPRFGQ